MISRTALTLVTAMASLPGMAVAQAVSENRVDVQTAWSVFVETDPRECWVVSRPTKTVNTRGGQEVEVRRGEILLYVTFRPESAVSGEVSFTGGYPFGPESKVRLQIGDTGFELPVDGEWAWPDSPETDARVVDALKSGTEAVLTGVSARGTTTRDTFSLLGITAALEEAQKRCTN